MVNKKAVVYTVLPFGLASIIILILMGLSIKTDLNVLLLITPISYVLSYFLIVKEKPSIRKPEIKSIVFSILAVILISTIVGLFMPKGEEQEILKTVKANNSFPLLTKFLVVVIGPFAEELYFRVGYRKILENDKVYLIVPSLIFGLSHLSTQSSVVVNLVIALSTTLTAMVFAYFYNKEENLFDVWIPHSIINFLAVI